MNENKIVYDSNEISSIVSNTKELINVVETDIKPQIDNDFQLLKELDFFTDGFDSIKTKLDKIILLNSEIVSSLNKHDEEMNSINNKHLSLFNGINQEETKTNSYSGESIVLDNINLKEITDGKTVLTTYISEVIPKFSYEEKVELLKNILKEEDSLSILTNTDESDIITYELKENIDSDYFIELSKLTKEEKKEKQKSFFNAISDNDTNIFDEMKKDSFLSGLSYLKQYAKKNDTTLSNLIFDDNKKELFMDAIKDIYNSDQIDVLTEEEVNSVKSYIDNISSKNNIEVNELLNNTKYTSILKGGINNENYY